MKFIISLLTTLFLFGCNFDGRGDIVSQPQINQLVRLEIEFQQRIEGDIEVKRTLGDYFQAVVVGHYEDGSSRRLPSESVEWSSDSPSIVAVDEKGILKGVGLGRAVITARLAELSSTPVVVLITDAVLTTIDVVPHSLSIAQGQSEQVTAIASWSDGSSSDETNRVTWSVTERQVAKVVAGGLVTGLSQGATNIRASIDEIVSIPANVVVSDAVLTSIVISPDEITLVKGQAGQLVATAIYSDGSQGDVTQSVSWTSGEKKIASISAKGALLGLAKGETWISAAHEGVSSNQAKIKVSDVAVSAIVVKPSSVYLTKGRSQQLKAVITYSDGTQVDATESVQWKTTHDNAVSVSSNGVISTSAVGDAKITATQNGIDSNIVNVTVTKAVVESLVVTPSSVDLAKGRTQKMTATVVYSDGKLVDVSSNAGWSVIDKNIVEVSTGGVLTGKGVGETRVAANWDGIDSDPVEVKVDYDPLEKAFLYENADFVSSSELYELIAREQSLFEKQCEKTVSEIYTNGEYPEQSVSINTSQKKAFISTSHANSPIQYYTDPDTGLSNVLTWVGELESSNRYAVFGYGMWRYKNFEHELGNSTKAILEWVLKPDFPNDPFSQHLIVLTKDARSDVRDWLAINAPNNNWTLINVNDEPERLVNGDYDFYVQRIRDVSFDGYNKPLLAHHKPIVAFFTGYSISQEDLAGFGLIEGANAYSHRTINIGQPSSLCDDALNKGGLGSIAVTTENLRINNTPVDFSLTSSCVDRGCDYQNAYTHDGQKGDAAFEFGLTVMRFYLDRLSQQGKNVFEQSSDMNILKAAVLLGDKYREMIRYPMDKTTDSLEFSKALFSERSIQLYRSTNKEQMDLGYYGLGITGSELSQLPTTKVDKQYVPTKSNSNWQSSMVYLLPGKTATIRRIDNQQRTVELRVNMLRNTQFTWSDIGYEGPKYVRSESIKLELNKEYKISHPFGGPLYLYFEQDGTLEPIHVEYDGVALHPTVTRDSGGVSSSQAQTLYNALLDKSQPFPIVDIVSQVTNAEYHVAVPVFIESLKAINSNTPDSFDALDIANWINDVDHYLIMDPYRQNGFLSPNFPDSGINQSRYVEDICSRLGISDLCSDLSIHGISSRKQHVNLEWRAACGQGCSGNPLDMSGVFVPERGYLIAHEVGHNIQTSKTKIYGSSSFEVSTNIYPYRSLAKYYKDVGIDSRSYSRASMQFDQAHLAIQTSILKNWVPNQNHPLWVGGDSTKWQDINGNTYATETVRRAFYTQFFFIHNSWDALSGVFILERIANDKIDDWDVYKNRLGLSHYTASEYKSMSAGDFMAISLSYITEKDHADYFEIWGIEVSPKAKGQIFANGTNSKLPLEIYKVPDNEYGDKNPIYGDLDVVVRPDNVRALDVNTIY